MILIHLTGKQQLNFIGSFLQYECWYSTIRMEHIFGIKNWGSQTKHDQRVHIVIFQCMKSCRFEQWKSTQTGVSVIHSTLITTHRVVSSIEEVLMIEADATALKPLSRCLNDKTPGFSRNYNAPTLLTIMERHSFSSSSTVSKCPFIAAA